MAITPAITPASKNKSAMPWPKLNLATTPAPGKNMSLSATPACGRRARMPIVITSETPLPMPRSVICSPSHMMKALPVVSVNMVIRTKPGPGLRTKSPPFSSPIAIPNDWTALRMTVIYRVHCVIFLRPSSPSFCNLANGS